MLKALSFRFDMLDFCGHYRGCEKKTECYEKVSAKMVKVFFRKEHQYCSKKTKKSACFLCGSLL